MKNLGLIILIIINFNFSIIAQTGEGEKWESLNNQMFIYSDSGNYPKAIEYAEKAVAQAKVEFGVDHPDYLYSCKNLASLYHITGDYKKALTIFQEIIQIQEKILGKNNEDYARACNSLATLYEYTGDYEKALSLYLEARQYYLRVYGKKHADYATSCNNLAALYQLIGNYQKALPLYKEANEIYKTILGKEHPDYGTSCNNLAEFYKAMGEYQKALPLYREDMQIIEKSFGKEHASYAQSCNNQAVLFQLMGDYQKAQKLLFEALELNEKVLGKNHIQYAKTCDDLSILYHSLGDNQKSLQFCKEAKQIRENVLGKDHYLYGSSCTSEASLYQSMGNYSKALPLFEEVRQIYEKTLGKEHSYYAISCNNLAECYRLCGQYQKALPLYIESKNIQEKTNGKQHPSYANACSNLSFLYKLMGNYREALPLSIEASKIYEKTLGRQHPNYAINAANLGAIYQEKGDLKKAEIQFLTANQNINNQINQNFHFLTEKEKELFIQNIELNFQTIHSFAYDYKEQKPGFVEINYNNELAYKGAVLKSSKAAVDAVLNSNIPELIAIYDNLSISKKMLGHQQSLSIANRTRNTDSLEQVANNMESKLLYEIQKYPELSKFSNFDKTPDWKDVQKALKPGEAAIEFISFRYRDRKNWTDSIFYCALVLRKESKYPKMIFLFKEPQLQELLPTSSGNSSGIDNLYQLNGTITSKNDGYHLYNLIWQPIESELQNIKTIYFAPSGLLHKISFNAIALPDKRFLSDKYKLNALSSTAIIVKNKQEFKIGQSSDIQIYGGISYHVSNDDMLRFADKYHKPDNQEITAFRPAILGATKRGESWSYLPGTLDEAKNISNLFNSAKLKVNFLSGKEANEESFKTLNGKNSPAIIHIATHGFFMPDPKKEYSDLDLRGITSFKASNNPLFRSGLMFSGSNAAWNNDSIPSEVEDGILTANEISQMYLPNTNLVVLSACETGLGEIKGGEGVFGLQRSFKMAGVDYIIMSLWQVPDEQTSELMQLFYKNLISGQTVRDSFSEAQNDLKVKYKESPFSWAAFVLIE